MRIEGLASSDPLNECSISFFFFFCKWNSSLSCMVSHGDEGSSIVGHRFIYLSVSYLVPYGYGKFQFLRNFPSCDAASVVPILCFGFYFWKGDSYFYATLTMPTLHKCLTFTVWRSLATLLSSSCTNCHWAQRYFSMCLLLD